MKAKKYTIVAKHDEYEDDIFCTGVFNSFEEASSKMDEIHAILVRKWVEANDGDEASKEFFPYHLYYIEIEEPEDFLSKFEF